MNVALIILASALLVSSCVAGFDANNACPPGWRHFASTSKCFKIIHEVTFDKAVAECERVNGSLASIHGRDENDFVRAHGTLVGAERILIGLVKSTSTITVSGIPTANPWEWNDGSAADFINWAPTEPNDNNPYGKQETCVEMHTTCMWGCDFRGRWNDVACDWPHYSAVCERAAGTPTSSSMIATAPKATASVTSTTVTAMTLSTSTSAPPTAAIASAEELYSLEASENSDEDGLPEATKRPVDRSRANEPMKQPVIVVFVEKHDHKPCKIGCAFLVLAAFVLGCWWNSSDDSTGRAPKNLMLVSERKPAKYVFVVSDPEGGNKF